MSEPILRVHVLGTPRPKGSLRAIKPGVLKETSATSPQWRADMAAVIGRALWVCDCPTPGAGCRQLRGGYPHTGPVVVELDFFFTRPATGNPYPSTRATGDLDKLCRNALDALVDAGCIKDDAQVVDLHASSRYTASAAGARITVTPKDPPERSSR